MKKAPFFIAVDTLVMLKSSSMIFFQLLTKELKSQTSRAESAQKKRGRNEAGGATVPRVAMGHSMWLRNISGRRCHLLNWKHPTPWTWNLKNENTMLVWGQNVTYILKVFKLLNLSLTHMPGERWWPVLKKGFLGFPLAPSLSTHMGEEVYTFTIVGKEHQRYFETTS